MTQPTKYVPGFDFSAFQGANPDTPLPGDKVDVELGNIQSSTDEIIDNLALIQRDDGKLANESVHLEALDTSVRTLIAATGGTVRGAWVTATSYAVKDIVTQGGITYICVTAHVSGTFATDLAAIKWIQLSVVYSAFVTSLLATTTAGGAMTVLGFSAFFQTLVDDVNAAGVLTTLGVSAFIQTLLDDTSAAAARTTLGVQTPISIDKRHTVLQGLTSSGIAAYLSAGAGLTLNILGTTTPLIVAFAQGFSAVNGNVDVLNQITADTTLAMTDATTNFVYADYNSGGAMAFGKVVGASLAPVYGYTHPGSPSVDQHSFLIHEMRMYRWTGAAWVAVDRVFLGEVVAAAGAITSVRPYAVRGVVDISQGPTIAVSTQYALSHNIGVGKMLTIEGYYENAITEGGFAVGDRIAELGGKDGATATQGATYSHDRTILNIVTAAALPSFRNKTTGATVAMTGANWRLGAIVERAF